MRNGSIDHQITGQFAMLLAERYDAIIDMGDKITPSHVERASVPGAQSQLPNTAHEHAEDVLGRCIESGFENEDTSRTFELSYMDAAFMRTWLKDPLFHMIK